ncbi:DUF1810 domain-containing protein [Pedobacter immunditicola]|uniref:DUF1810 domain-containing protein n=1 Tax=Pedobacter immunditicola TaxID=3133440 RepID=UPI0030ABBD8A
MSLENSLNRFVDAQETEYQVALAEIKIGKKRSHWMWFIFPQIEGLGLSETSRRYSIKDLKEAEDYLQHPVVGKRLIEISNELLKVDNDDANDIFGSPDDLKLQSSMTLFSSLTNTHPVFQLILEKFFKGARDEKTLQLIGRQV